MVTFSAKDNQVKVLGTAPSIFLSQKDILNETIYDGRYTEKIRKIEDMSIFLSQRIQVHWLMRVGQEMF